MTQRDPRYRLGITLALLGGITLSPGGLLIRFIEDASDWQLVMYRSFFIGLSVLAVLAVRYRGRLVRPFRAAGWTGLWGGLILGAGYVCYVLAVRHTTVANALFLISTAPFMAAAMGWLLMGERVPLATWAAMGWAVVGVGVMVAEGLSGGRMFGNLMGMGAALTFAGVAITWRLRREVDMTPTVCISGFSGALAAALLADDWSISGHDLALCALMGGVQVSLGFLLLTRGARHVPTAQLTLLSLVEVVLAPIWVWLVLGEVPALLTLIGGLIVLSAIVAQAAWGIRHARRA